jgi:hypothetical protein
LNSSWEHTHVIVQVFEVQNTTCAIMANRVKIIFDSFGLLDKVIIYVKNKGSNLNTLTNVFIICNFLFLLSITSPFVQDHVLAMQC